MSMLGKQTSIGKMPSTSAMPTASGSMGAGSTNVNTSTAKQTVFTNISQGNINFGKKNEIDKNLVVYAAVGLIGYSIYKRNK